jgi:hypothetical protein
MHLMSQLRSHYGPHAQSAFQGLMIVRHSVLTRAPHSLPQEGAAAEAWLRQWLCVLQGMCGAPSFHVVSGQPEGLIAELGYALRHLMATGQLDAGVALDGVAWGVMALARLVRLSLAESKMAPQLQPLHTAWQLALYLEATTICIAGFHGCLGRPGPAPTPASERLVAGSQCSPELLCPAIGELLNDVASTVESLAETVMEGRGACPAGEERPHLPAMALEAAEAATRLAAVLAQGGLEDLTPRLAVRAYDTAAIILSAAVRAAVHLTAFAGTIISSGSEARDVLLEGHRTMISASKLALLITRLPADRREFVFFSISGMCWEALASTLGNIFVATFQILDGPSCQTMPGQRVAEDARAPADDLRRSVESPGRVGSMAVTVYASRGPG